MNFVLVFLGGGIGCVIRYCIGLFFQKTSLSLPWATLISNISACFIFAIVLWLSQPKNIINTHFQLFLLLGFCGGLSTFSSFGYETFLLFKQGMFFYAMLNIIITTAISLSLFYLFK